MNNATREDSVRPVSLPPANDQDDSAQFFSEDSFKPIEQQDDSDLLDPLNQIRYTPRAATIRAIMKYAHEKNEAIH
ncbi:MAG TPA: hypothetical protein VFX43_21380 [Chitinophagaceae bacterium]|jgi:hypothetical protein|nr:hypothetical protein [Chitinophagaceae bacterium]